MNTREIWHELLVHATPAELYAAISDVKGLAHWWTIDTRGESRVGGRLEFWFDACRAAVMQVLTLKPLELVRWHATEDSIPDWRGTDVEFAIFERNGQTFLHFRHSNWQHDAPQFAHCSMGWAIFLLSLKEYVETGKGRPYPYDMPVNMWKAPEAIAAGETAR